MSGRRIVILRSGKVGDHAVLACQLRSYGISKVILTSIRGAIVRDVYTSVGISVECLSIFRIRPGDTVIVFEHPRHSWVLKSLFYVLSFWTNLVRPEVSVDQYGQAEKVVQLYLEAWSETGPSNNAQEERVPAVLKHKTGEEPTSILIAPHGSEPSKNLSSASCNRLIAKIVDYLDSSNHKYTITIVPDTKLAKEISINTTKSVGMDVAPNLGAYLSLVAGADVIVGVDSSAVALANLYQIPFVCLQGMRLDPIIWQANRVNYRLFPDGYYITDDDIPCKHCAKFSCELGSPCVNGVIQLDAAVNLVFDILERKMRK